MLYEAAPDDNYFVGGGSATDGVEGEKKTAVMDE